MGLLRNGPQGSKKPGCAEQMDFPVAHNNSLGKLSSTMQHKINIEKDEHLTSLSANVFYSL